MNSVELCLPGVDFTFYQLQGCAIFRHRKAQICWFRVNWRSVQSGDKNNPMYHGYTCIKGSQLASQHYNPERLTHSVKRLKSGAYSAIDSEVAMDEIATGLTEIINQYGPRAVALYSGSFGFPYPASGPMAAAFMHAGNQFTHAVFKWPYRPTWQAHCHGTARSVECRSSAIRQSRRMDAGGYQSGCINVGRNSSI